VREALNRGTGAPMRPCAGLCEPDPRPRLRPVGTSTSQSASPLADCYTFLAPPGQSPEPPPQAKPGGRCFCTNPWHPRGGTTANRGDQLDALLRCDRSRGSPNDALVPGPPSRKPPARSSSGCAGHEFKCPAVALRRASKDGDRFQVRRPSSGRWRSGAVDSGARCFAVRTRLRGTVRQRVQCAQLLVVGTPTFLEAFDTFVAGLGRTTAFRLAGETWRVYFDPAPDGHENVRRPGVV